MLTDLRFEDLAAWITELASIKLKPFHSAEDEAQLGKWTMLVDLWLQTAESLTQAKRHSNTEFWDYVESLFDAGVNAESLLATQVEAESIFESPGQSTASTMTPTRLDPEKEREWILSHLIEAMAYYLTVDAIDGQTLPFDLRNNNSRSAYQLLSYGPLLEDLENLNTPVGKPYYEVRTKPRQVGSTTFWEKLAALFLQTIPGYKVCIQFPAEGDATEHIEKVLKDLKRMAEHWPGLFYSVTKANVSKGVVKLSNGSELHCRHGGGSGVIKVGNNFNMFVASEAGKYERHNPGAWKTINTAIIPAVHSGPYNIVAWEGTNDELAYELNRVAGLPGYRFMFFGWKVIKEYIGPPVNKPQTDPNGRYHDYEIVDANRVNISEREYGLRNTLSPDQLGFRRQKIDALGDLDLFHQEYPLTYNESQISGTIKFFPSVLLQRKFPKPKRKLHLHAECYVDKRPTLISRLEVEQEESSDGRWWVWHEPGNFDVVLAGDFSDGIPGGDYTSLGGYRVQDGVQVAGAKFRGGKNNEIAIVEELAKFTAYYGVRRTKVIGELDAVGKAVRSRWIDFGHSLNYHRVLTRKSYDEYSDSMWFTQTTTTRGAALLALRTAIANGEFVINDERWLWDAEDFIKHKSGKYAGAEAASRVTGEKVRDDMVMQSALGWEGIVTHSKRAKRSPSPVKATAKQHASRRNSVLEDICYGDLQGGLLGRLINGHTRR